MKVNLCVQTSPARKPFQPLSHSQQSNLPPLAPALALPLALPLQPNLLTLRVCMQAHYREHSKMTYARSVFVIHNMAHQGRGPMAELPPLEIPAHHTESFRLYDPIGGEHMNIMKAGIHTAHRIVAVSHG